MNALVSAIYGTQAQLCPHACHLLWHFVKQRTEFPPDVPSEITRPLRKRNSASIPLPEMQSTPLDVCLCPALLSAPPGWEAVNTTTAENKTIASRINAAVCRHTEPTLVRQQLKNPEPSGSWGKTCVNRRSINLILIHSPLAASHRHTSPGRRWLCRLCACCNYNHLCQSCITHDRKELSGDTCDPVANEWALQ